MDRGRMACSGTCSSILGRVYLLVPPTPLPPVYWNHRLSDKTRNNILESTAYGQNLEPQGLSGLLGPQVVWNQPILCRARGRTRSIPTKSGANRAWNCIISLLFYFERANASRE